jgi:hypothetical protein
MYNELVSRIAACEQENVRLRKQLKRQGRVWTAALLVAMIGTATASIATKTAVFDSIQAKDITIVDANGVVRARMSGDMPDAVMAGGRVSKRGAKAAGFMIYDREGIERGGYVTFDHDTAMLSLDSKYHMVANMVAGPDESGTAGLDLITGKKGISLRSDDNGTRISMLENGAVRQQTPAIEVGADSCTEYKSIGDGEHWCRTRFTESACNKCLGK